jgi:signal transduction histidine kinase
MPPPIPGLDELLHVVVEDSGVGFEPTPATPRPGVGLRSVGDRLSVHYEARATLHVVSRVGQGTSIEIDLPAESRPYVERRAV